MPVYEVFKDNLPLFEDSERDYDYPYGLDLRPNSELHRKIVTNVLARASKAKEAISQRYDKWAELDRTLSVYIPADEKTAKREVNKSEPIIVPYTYAALDTLMTYIVATMLDEPILKYEGVGPEDVVGATMLEHVIKMQSIKGKLALALYTLFRDSIVYGIGPGSVVWEKKEAYVRRPAPNLFGLFTKKRMVKEVVFEGSVLRPIDPYSFFPDPDTPIQDIQRAEFVGWIERTTIYDVLSRDKEGELFNVKYLYDKKQWKSSLYGSTESGRELIKLGDFSVDSRHADLIYMYINLIPKEWGLSDKKYPEKWLFIVAGDSVVVYAKKLNLDHGMFPVVVGAPEFDGHSVSPISRLEAVFGLQKTADWLFSSHIANVKKSINDMIIVDPFLVNIMDLKTPRPGKIVRLRRAAWGRGVDGVLKQLNVADVTKTHIVDSSIIADIIKQVTGAVDPVQGLIPKRGERVSAAEARGSRRSALGRLEKMVRILGMQVIYDLGYMFASHTQQLMSKEVYVRLEGEFENVLRQEFGTGSVKIRPSDLLIDFDVVVNDGSLPSGEYADLWIQLYQVALSNPQIANTLDMVRVFMHIARIMGAKNIGQFLRRGAKVVPDEMALREAEKGNLVSVEPENGRLLTK